MFLFPISAKVYRISLMHLAIHSEALKFLLLRYFEKKLIGGNREESLKAPAIMERRRS